MKTPTARTYDARHATALDVYAGFLGDSADPQMAADALVDQYGVYGSFAVDFVMGDVWCRPHLSRRDRSMLVIALLGTQRAHEEMAAHIEIGLRHGLTRDEVDEIVIQMAPYAGCPAAAAAGRVVRSTFERLNGPATQPAGRPAPAKDDSDRRNDALEVQRSMFHASAATPDEALQRALDAYGPVGQISFEWALGEVWSRPQLSRRDRSLITLAILGFLSLERQFTVHVRGALNNGCTADEILETMVQLSVYGGLPRAVEGSILAENAIAAIKHS